MLKQCAFKPFPYLSFECLSIYFFAFLKLNLTRRHGGNGGFMQGCVAHEGVLMLNR